MAGGKELESKTERRVAVGNSVFYRYLFYVSHTIPRGTSDIDSWLTFGKKFNSPDLLAGLDRDAQITMAAFQENSSKPVKIGEFVYNLAEPLESFNQRVKVISSNEIASATLVAGSPEVSVYNVAGKRVGSVQDAIVLPTQPKSFTQAHYWQGEKGYSSEEILFSASPLVPMSEEKIVAESTFKDIIRLYLDGIGAIAKTRQFSCCVGQGEWPNFGGCYVNSSHIPLDWIESFKIFSKGHWDDMVYDSNHKYIKAIIKEGGQRLGLGDRADDVIRRRMIVNFPLPPIKRGYDMWETPREVTVGNMLAFIYAQIESDVKKQLRLMSVAIGQISNGNYGNGMPGDLVKVIYSTWLISLAKLFQTQINDPIKEILGLSPEQIRKMNYVPIAKNYPSRSDICDY
ncbi:hypothetical protein KBB48_03185 [Candidatus Shapirobacteria bacterium]|nr:hypothetical protein [Candidatus Shapirobacteria bacterium]